MRSYEQMTREELLGELKRKDDVIAQILSDGVDALEALRKEVTLNQIILNSVQAVVLIQHPDASIVYVNAFGENLSGYLCAELLGHTVWDLLLPPEDMDSAREAWERLQQEGDLRYFENRWKTKTGELRRLAWTSTVLSLSTGEPGYVIGIALDVTRKKEIEDALQESEARYRLLFDIVPTGIVITTFDGDLVKSNDAARQITGYGSDDWPANLENSYQDRDDRLHLLKAVRDFGSVHGFEVVLKRKDGTLYTALLNVELVDYDGQQVLLTCIQDITERKRVEDALRQSREQLRTLNLKLEHRVQERTEDLQRLNRELECFCHSISHELRAPIARLIGFSATMAEAVVAARPETISFITERISSASVKLRSVVDSLLMLNRLSRSEMSKESVNLSQLAELAAKELQEEAPERDVAFTIAPDLVAFGDRGMLAICIHNLFDNAFKFTGKQCKAQIEFLQTELPVGRTFFIRDNGAGFNMDYSAKLFEPFYRLHNEEEFEGSGIGLSTVQRIVERHGGRIWAEAEVGKGATFYFTLSTD